MTRARNGCLLERLRRGPLASDDWAEVGASRKSLHVRINQLRERGFIIAADTHNPICSTCKRSAGRPLVTYRLVSEPEERKAA